MHRSRFWLSCLLWWVVATSPNLLFAQDATTPKEEADPHAAVRPFIDSLTVVVGWLDLTKIDVNEVATFTNQANIPTVDDQLKKRLIAIQKALLQLEAKRIYWIADIKGLENGPNVVVIPTKKANATALLLGTIVDGESQAVKVVGDCVLAGDPWAIAALEGTTGKASETLNEAIAGCKGSHGIAFVLPPTMLGKVITASEPLLPKGPEALAKAAEVVVSVRSLSLSGELPPAQGHLQISSKSVEAAKIIAGLANSLASERLGDAATLLKLHPEGSNVVLPIDTPEIAVKQLAAIEKFSIAKPDIGRSMKQVGLALHNFADVYRHFPPQSLVDKNGKRLLSWRVLILPYLEQSALYQQFHLDEPWDSEHNLKLAQQIPPMFAMANAEGKDKIKTRIVAPLTPESVFGVKGKPIYFDRVIDGTSNTIWVVEAAPSQAVVWTKPDDLVWDAKQPYQQLMSADADGFYAGFADGAVRFIERDVSVEFLNATLTIAGEELIDVNKLEFVK